MRLVPADINNYLTTPLNIRTIFMVFDVSKPNSSWQTILECLI